MAVVDMANGFSATVQNARMAPYMSQLRSSATEPMLCQGVLVDPSFALFTRMCAEMFDEGDKVVIGATRIDGGLSDGEWIPVRMKHYSPNESLDFAMVELERPAKFKPVGIVWDDLAPGTVTWMRGWLPFTTDPYAKNLKETIVQIVANNQCKSRNVPSDQVCADNDGFKGCSSYIYGSLIFEIGGKDFVAGLLSRYWCATSPSYQIFNRISAARSFIEPFLCKGA